MPRFEATKVVRRRRSLVAGNRATTAEDKLAVVFARAVRGNKRAVVSFRRVIESTESSPQSLLARQGDGVAILIDIESYRVAKRNDLKEATTEVRLIARFVDLRQCASQRSVVAGLKAIPPSRPLTG